MKTLFKAFRVVAHLMYVGGLLILCLLPTNKYNWMQEIDPSIVIEDHSGNASTFLLVILMFMVLFQSILVVRARDRKEKIISLTLILFAIILYSLKTSAGL